MIARDPLLSVVITNYNYEHFVGEAIESALKLSTPSLEIIVVDDGSTDNSRAIIASYVPLVTALFLPNQRQRAAAVRGFTESSGDVVIFLDSDDILPRDLPSHLWAVWEPGITKVQFSAQRIDRCGKKLGDPFPKFKKVPSSAEMSSWARETSAYPTPPGSSNAYSRWFLESVLPVSEQAGDFLDSACLAAAPFLGEVVVAADVEIGYRQHGENDSDLMADRRRFQREVDRAIGRWQFVSSLLEGTETVDFATLRKSRELLQLRICARKIGEGRGLEEDSRWRLAVDAIRSPFMPGPERLGKRIGISLWSILTLMCPASLSSLLVGLRYGFNRKAR